MTGHRHTAVAGFRTPGGLTIRAGDVLVGHPCRTRPGHLILHEPGDLPGWAPGPGPGQPLRQPCGYLLLAPARRFAREGEWDGRA